MDFEEIFNYLKGAHPHQLFVGNLTWWTTDDDLISEFNKNGVHVAGVKILEDTCNGCSLGFGCVGFELAEDLAIAESKVPELIVRANQLTAYLFNFQNFMSLVTEAILRGRLREGNKEEGTKETLEHENDEEHNNWSNENPVEPQTSFRSHDYNHSMRGNPHGNDTAHWNYNHRTRGIPWYSPPQVNSYQHTQWRSRRPFFWRRPRGCRGSYYCRPPVTPWYCGTTQSSSTPSILNFDAQKAAREQNFETILMMNKKLCSSAIQRSVALAVSGDISKAKKVLLAAITAIEESGIASDERCKGLLHSLNDTINSMGKIYDQAIEYSHQKGKDTATSLSHYDKQKQHCKEDKKRRTYEDKHESNRSSKRRDEKN